MKLKKRNQSRQITKLFALFLMIFFISLCAYADDDDNDSDDDQDDCIGICGNGTAEAGEVCDGFDLNRQTCISLGHPSGTLACTSDCQFDVSGCDTPQKELVLWNTLGSEQEVLNSEKGPNLSFAVGNTSRTRYVSAVYGNGVTLIGGPYYNMQRIRNIVLSNLNSYLDPEKGTIECWYKQNEDPIGYSHGVYRIFDGFYGLNAGISLLSFHADPPYGPKRLFFSIEAGGTYVSTFSEADGNDGVDISAYNGEWIHIGAVWNRNGINGSSDTVRLYVNGIKVGSNTDNRWGTVFGHAADICGGNDHNIENKFYIDNLKIWNYSKTDFSDRIHE